MYLRRTNIPFLSITLNFNFFVTISAAFNLILDCSNHVHSILLSTFSRKAAVIEAFVIFQAKCNEIKKEYKLTLDDFQISDISIPKAP